MTMRQEARLELLLLGVCLGSLFVLEVLRS